MRPLIAALRALIVPVITTLEVPLPLTEVSPAVVAKVAVPLELVSVSRSISTAGFTSGSPTMMALPWPAETPYPDRIDGRAAGPRDHAIFTGWVNIVGAPAVSMPVGLSRAGLPIGAQLAANFGADESLLAFVREVSRAVSPPPLPHLEAVS